MKFVALVVLTLAVFGGYKAFSKSAAVETVYVTAPTQQLFNPTNSLTSATKAIEKHTVNQDRVVYLDDVVDTGLTLSVANRIKELNAKSSADIYLLINSPGGSVLDGAILVSEMQASRAHIMTVCTGLCASMAAVIHSYGYKRYAVDRSILMYHPASGGAQGQIPNMLSQLNTIAVYIDEMTGNIINRSKVSRGEFEGRVSYEMWVEANEATRQGFNDAVVSLNVPLLEMRQGSGESLPPGERRKNGTIVIEPSAPKASFMWISPHPELWTFLNHKN